MFDEASWSGSIINFGSVSTRIGSNFPAYMTAKAGAHGLTKGLARDLGPFNIRVNKLVRGWVMTERQRREHLTPEGEARIDALQAFPRASSPTISRRWHCFWLLMTARCVHRRNYRGRRLDLGSVQRTPPFAVVPRTVSAPAASVR
ncbi:SDR family oxidoreductase [Mesorhizobium sp.]|uniref:SDR family oxidoreductase n=1 Tax=Mesorhizobium sp. TaxID=1871066 RepID=UPI00257FAF4B|nr:SDR family oxidoreductase [Mesorhizobium sp.]